jgi:hypothetical protein
MAGRLLALRTGRAVLPRNIIFLLLVLISVKRLSKPPGLVRLEGLGKLKKFNNFIGFRTCNLPACSIVLQPLRYSRSYQLSNCGYFRETKAAGA